MAMEDSSTKKRVPLSRVKPGVYVVGLDQSWFKTPFYFHRRLIKDAQEIELLKKHGISEVIIDTALGADVEAEVSAPATATIPVVEKPQSAPETEPPSLSPPETAFRSLVQEIETARSVHEEALSVAQNIFNDVTGGSRLNSPIARRVVMGLLGSITRSAEANLFLAQMRRFHHDLFTHAVNVCVLCLVVGTFDEGLDNEISALGMGALLHDLGYTRLPHYLMARKRTDYTDTERELVEQHPTLGAVLINQTDNIPEGAQRIVAEHHERINGSGYPLHLRGNQIALLSQIVSIADTYDSLLTGRYLPPMQPIEVLRELYVQSNAGAFDRPLIERVIRCLGVYPAGSLVELDTGERGIVIAANRNDSLKPILRLISSREGLALAKGPIISLAGGDGSHRRIVRALDPGKERIDVLSYVRVQQALSA